MTTEQIIKRWMEAEDGSHLTIPCARFYRGHKWMAECPYDAEPGDGWQEREAYNNGYRAVWVNDAERAVFTYCEGDLDLTIDATDAEFNARLNSIAAFYGRDAA